MPDQEGSNLPPPAVARTTVTSITTEETWSQFVRSDKGILLWLYIFLVMAVMHSSHDQLDKELVPFLREGATGAFSGLMVALRGRQVAAQPQ